MKPLKYAFAAVPLLLLGGCNEEAKQNWQAVLSSQETPEQETNDNQIISTDEETYMELDADLGERYAGSEMYCEYPDDTAEYDACMAVNMVTLDIELKEPLDADGQSNLAEELCWHVANEGGCVVTEKHSPTNFVLATITAMPEEQILATLRGLDTVTAVKLISSTTLAEEASSAVALEVEPTRETMPQDVIEISFIVGFNEALSKFGYLEDMCYAVGSDSCTNKLSYDKKSAVLTFVFSEEQNVSEITKILEAIDNVSYAELDSIVKNVGPAMTYPEPVKPRLQ
jgi:hypothetical protein